MEDIIKAFEKWMVGTVLRGLLWVFAWVSATFGVQAPDDAAATQFAGFIGAVIAAGVALLWSRLKDRIWKSTPPGR